MSRGPDSGALLQRALIAAGEAAGCAITVTRSDTRRWASATFVGAQHEIALSAQASPRLDAWVVDLPEAEFVLRGHLVADLVVTRVTREGAAVTVQLEVLTVEEC